MGTLLLVDTAVCRLHSIVSRLEAKFLASLILPRETRALVAWGDFGVIVAVLRLPLR